MLFHLGALWRLNELGYLPKLGRISSVSGGSITAGVLGHRWSKLDFANGVAANFQSEVVATIRSMASHTIDVGDVLKGIFLPGTVGDRIVASYNDSSSRTRRCKIYPILPASSSMRRTSSQAPCGASPGRICGIGAWARWRIRQLNSRLPLVHHRPSHCAISGEAEVGQRRHCPRHRR